MIRNHNRNARCGGGMGGRKLITSVRSILSDGLDYIYCIANGSSRKRTRGLHCWVQIPASPILWEERTLQGEVISLFGLG